MSGPAFEFLLFGHDTIECSYYLRATGGQGIDFERLGVEKEALRQMKGRDPKVVRLGSMEFLLQRYGSSSGYPFVLDCPEFAIQCGEFNSPPFYVTYRSAALWEHGAWGMHERFLEWARGLGMHEYASETLGRTDFTFDYYLPAVEFNEDSFVSLAALDSKHRHDRVLRGVTFGKGDVVLRIYDKVAEIQEKSGKVWFFQLWGRSDNVWRIEWQARKDLLRRFGIRTFADLAALQGDALRYLAHEHDTLRVPNGDANRSRWALHPLWVDLQEQIGKLEAQGVHRVVDVEAAIRERLTRLAVSIYGYVKRVGALHCVLRGEPTVSFEDAMGRLEQQLRWVHDPLTWAADLEKRIEQTRLGQ